MTLGNKKSYEDWLEHYRDTVSRGLRCPLTVITDGAPGLIKAVNAMWPKAERIRCWVHKVANILDKVPDAARPVLKSWLEAVRDAPNLQTGLGLAAKVRELLERDYPSAVKCLLDDLEALLAHLKFPNVHRKHIRTTNLVERRRTKVIPRFRGERECLKLVFATLWRASERWKRVCLSEHERRQLDKYRREREQRERDVKNRQVKQAV